MSQSTPAAAAHEAGAEDAGSRRRALASSRLVSLCGAPWYCLPTAESRLTSPSSWSIRPSSRFCSRLLTAEGVKRVSVVGLLEAGEAALPLCSLGVIL